MAKVFASTTEMNQEAWLKARKKGIGGSDIAAIMGLNKYASPVTVFMDKLDELPKDEVYKLNENGGFQEGSEAAYWGTVQEETVAKEFQKRTGMKVRRRNAILQHEDYPYFLANVDRMIVGKKEGLECKTASEYLKGEWEEDQVPDNYFIQCQWYMNITGYKKWHLAVLIGGNKFRHFEVERDDELIEILNNKADHFWQHHVLAGNPPEFDGSEASTELVAKMYPEHEEQSIDLPPEFTDDLEQHERLKKQIKELNEAKKEIENRIKGTMGEKKYGFAGERKVTWSRYTSTRFDSKAFKKDHPDLFEEYAKESNGSKFIVK